MIATCSFQKSRLHGTSGRLPNLVGVIYDTGGGALQLAPRRNQAPRGRALWDHERNKGARALSKPNSGQFYVQNEPLGEKDGARWPPRAIKSGARPRVQSSVRRWLAAAAIDLIIVKLYARPLPRIGASKQQKKMEAKNNHELDNRLGGRANSLTSGRLN